MASPSGEAPVPEELYFKVTDVASFSKVPVFSIRNGTPENARNLLIRATIPAAYHWTPIQGMDPANALTFVEAYIASARKRIAEYPPTGMTDAQKRKVAICLGVSRAVATAYYTLSDADLIPGETSTPAMIYQPPANPTVEGDRGRVHANMEMAPVQIAEVLEPVNLTNDEANIITVLLRCTLGTVPLQGLSLIQTNHHYLSDPATQSRKAYAAVERQFWREDTIKDWIEEDKALLQDVLWHKACHPINLSVKYRTACSEVVKEQLLVAGCGSAAARLPAVETEAKAATAYIHLFESVEPMFNMYEGSINFDLLKLSLAVLKEFEPGLERAVRPTDLPEVVPPTVVNRRTALAWVSDIVKNNSATAAHCYGFYCAMAERSLMAGGSAGTDSLRNSFALKKLTSNFAPSYAVGFEQYSDYTVARAKDRKAGRFVAPTFTLT